MTIESLQIVFNVSSTIVLLALGLRWVYKDNRNSFVKTILIVIGILGLINIFLNL
jgi:hypothetical protein